MYDQLTTAVIMAREYERATYIRTHAYTDMQLVTKYTLVQNIFHFIYKYTYMYIQGNCTVPVYSIPTPENVIIILPRCTNHAHIHIYTYTHICIYYASDKYCL